MAVAIVGTSQLVVRRTMCINCASILEYTKMDTFVRHYKDIDGTSDTDRYIVCPKCAKDVIVGHY